MKLSNSQINAIINQIAKQEQLKLDADHKKQNEALVKQKKPIAKKYFAMYKALPVELRSLLRRHTALTEKEILESLIKTNKKTFNKHELYSKIVLASIDSKDLEQLKKKLKIQF